MRLASFFLSFFSFFFFSLIVRCESHFDWLPLTHKSILLIHSQESLRIFKNLQESSRILREWIFLLLLPVPPSVTVSLFLARLHGRFGCSADALRCPHLHSLSKNLQESVGPEPHSRLWLATSSLFSFCFKSIAAWRSASNPPTSYTEHCTLLKSEMNSGLNSNEFRNSVVVMTLATWLNRQPMQNAVLNGTTWKKGSKIVKARWKWLFTAPVVALKPNSKRQLLSAPMRQWTVPGAETHPRRELYR